jgi:hypothetical protein
MKWLHSNRSLATQHKVHKEERNELKLRAILCALCGSQNNLR